MAVEDHLNVLVMKYGYAGIFIALALGVFGLPIPDEVLMTYVGYAVTQGILHMPFALLSAFLGASAGISISYAVGYKWGLPLLLKVGPYLHITPKKVENAQRLFAKYGPFLLLIGYFLPGLRHITAYLAGMSSMNFRKFAGFAYTGAFVWSLAFIGLGGALGKDWFKVAIYGRQYGLYIVLAALVIAMAVYVFKLAIKNKTT